MCCMQSVPSSEKRKRPHKVFDENDWFVLMLMKAKTFCRWHWHTHKRSVGTKNMRPTLKGCWMRKNWWNLYVQRSDDAIGNKTSLNQWQHIDMVVYTASRSTRNRSNKHEKTTKSWFWFLVSHTKYYIERILNEQKKKYHKKHTHSHIKLFYTTQKRMTKKFARNRIKGKSQIERNQ